MLVAETFTTGPEECAYLPHQQATLTYDVVIQMTPEEYEARMNQGWRKFGAFVFKPACAACCECQPVRLPVADFRPDRSQRRAVKRNADLAVRLAPPTLDAARFDLYRRYHAAQALRKGWPDSEKDAEDYYFNFVQNPLPSLELSVWEGDVLRAIVINDLTPNVVSAVYHYHDPDCAERSLGTFSIMRTIELARLLEKPYVYFGYYVAGCGSMAYKARFRPVEALGMDGVWHPLAPDGTAVEAEPETASPPG